jgi:acetyl esterase/lipase
MDFHQQAEPSPYLSYTINAEGYGVTNTHMALFWDLYIEKTEDRNHPYCSPMRAGNLSDLPPALLFTSEYDVLRDEGEQYGLRLHEAGVPVLAKRFNGMIHGFIQFFPEEDVGVEAFQFMNSFVHEKAIVRSK